MQQQTQRNGTKQLKWLVGLLAAAILIGFIFLNQRREITQHAPPGLVLWAKATAEEKPIPAELLARGRRIYGSQCATCHGKTGAGDGPASLYLATPPRDFTQLVFKFRTTENFPSDQDLFRSISAGFPAYGMPSFRYLAEEERWSLVHYVKKLAKDGYIQALREEEGQAFDLKNATAWVSERMTPGNLIRIADEPPAKPDSLIRGRAFYEKTCIPCHGATGRGDGPSAATLRDNWDRPISPRNFTLGPVARKAGWRRADLVRVLMTGIPGTPMPSQGGMLENPNDLTLLWDISRYVDHLTEQAQEEKTGGQP